MANVYLSDKYDANDLRHASQPGRASDVLCERCTVSITAALTQYDILKLIKLPPYCIPVDAVVALTDLDDAASLTWDLGVLDTTRAALVSSSLAIDGEATVGQAAGITRMDEDDWFFPATYLAETDCDGLEDGLHIAIEIMTAPGSAVSSGTAVVDIYYRATQFDK